MTAPIAILTFAGVGAGLAIAWLARTPAPANAGNPDRELSTIAAWAAPVRVVLVGHVVLVGAGAVVLALSGELGGGALLIGAGLLALGLGARAAAGARGVAAADAADMAADPRTNGTVQAGDPIVARPLRVALIAILAGVGLLAYASLAVEHGIPLLGNDPQLARTGYTGLRLDLFRWLVAPAALVLVAAAVDRPSGRWRLAAITALAAVAGLGVLAASRALPLEMGLAAGMSLAWSGRSVDRRIWLGLGLAGLAIFFGVLFARVGPGGGFRDPVDWLGFAVDRTAGRVALIQPRTVELIVETYPAQEPYLGGATYLRWVDRLQGRPPSTALGSDLFARMFPDQPGGFLTPGVLGEGQANFGPLFAIGLMGLIGLAAGGLGRLLPALAGDPAGRTLAALLAVALVRTAATSLLGFAVTAAAAVFWWLVVAAPVRAWLTSRRRPAEAPVTTRPPTAGGR